MIMNDIVEQAQRATDKAPLRQGLDVLGRILCMSDTEAGRLLLLSLPIGTLFRLHVLAEEHLLPSRPTPKFGDITLPRFVQIIRGVMAKRIKLLSHPDELLALISAAPSEWLEKALGEYKRKMDGLNDSPEEQSCWYWASLFLIRELALRTGVSIDEEE